MISRAKPAEAPALLVDPAGAAAMLGISRTSLYGLLSAGRIPLPVLKAGRIVRWNRGELLAWIRAGCPTRDRWEPLKGDRV
jgi:excisionase family DNA binding protein